MTDSDSQTTSDSLVQRIPWRRIAHLVGLILLIAIVVPFVVYAVPQVVGAEHSYVVLSGSMEPVMSPGDAVIVNSVAAADVEKGDIIAFSTSGDRRPTTHRVIEVVQQDGSVAFRTAGDAVEDSDPALVTPEQIEGKVMSVGGFLFVIPLIGYVIRFAGTQVGFVALFVVPVVLFVLNEIWNIVTAARTNTASGGTGESDNPDPADVADVDDTDGEPATAARARESDDVAETSDGGITFTTAELQLGLVVLAAFVAYSAWVAYTTTTIWSFGVAGGTGTAFLLLSMLYLFGGGGSDSEDVDSEIPDAAAADGEGSDATQSQAVDPDVELDLLEDVVAQRPDEDAGQSATDGGKRHPSDSEATPTESPGERQEARSESESGERPANAGAPGGEDSE